MRNILFLFLILGLASCNKTTNNVVTTEKKAVEKTVEKVVKTTDGAKEVVSDATVADNEELKQIYKDDQGDRRNRDEIDWKVLRKNDSLREVRVYELIDEGKVITGQDHFNAAMIFQHGGDTIASGMAVKMMRKAVDLDPKVNNWLLAAAIDRDLMYRGKPQIYGTQFRRDGAGTPWYRYELDSMAVTDEERRAYKVETLAQQQEKVKRMNKKKLGSLLADGTSIDEIVTMCKKDYKGKSDYDMSEGAINSLGYQLMGAKKMEDALKIFVMNTELYPEAYNPFDSLGECLLEMGQKEAGIKAYKKSLELNPKNDNATKVLTEMGAL